MKFIAKKGIQIVHQEENIALLYFWGNRIFVEGDQVGDLLAPMLQLLSSPHSIEEIVSNFGSNAREQVLEIFNILSKSYLLAELGDSQTGEIELENEYSDFIASFLNRKDWSHQILKSLNQKNLGVINLSSIGSALEREIQTLPINRLVTHDLQYSVSEEALSNAIETVSGLDLVIVSGTWHDQSWLFTINKFFQKSGQRWLLVMQDYYGGSIGPIFTKGGICFNCLLQRRSANLESYDKQILFENYFSGKNEKLKMNFSVFQNLLAGSVKVELLKILTDVMLSKTYQSIISFDFLNHRHETHSVLPLSNCLVCSNATQRPN